MHSFAVYLREDGLSIGTFGAVGFEWFPGWKKLKEVKIRNCVNLIDIIF